GGDVGSGLGLRERECDELPTCGQIRDPAGVLFLRAGEEERQRCELVDRRNEPGRRTGAAQLHDGEAEAQQFAAQTAVLRREWQREDVLLREQLAKVLGER